MIKSAKFNVMIPRDIAKAMAVPLILLVALLIFISIYKLLGLPSSHELIRLAQGYYSRHGYLVVFVGALVKGLLVVGWYLPGLSIIVLGVVLSREAGLNVGLLVGLVVVAFLIDSVINYLLGRYGWYRLLVAFGLGRPLEEMQGRVVKNGLPLVFYTYFHPNVATLTATSCGVLRLPFWRFVGYSAGALLLWNALGGAIVYLSGPAVLGLLDVRLAIPLILIWMAVAVYRSFRLGSTRGHDTGRR